MKTMTKRLTTALLCVVLTVLMVMPMASAAIGLQNFKKNSYFDEYKFVDVSADKWFYEGVRSACQYGIMKGNSSFSFNPTGELTVAEALVIACRLHSTYFDNGTTFTQGSPWYQVYVDYATEQRIMRRDELDPTEKITRKQFAYLMCGAIPTSELRAINNVTSIPDVVVTSTYGHDVYRLYNAGVLTGNDQYGTFTPEATIQRGAVATIVTRIVDPSLRKTFVLEQAAVEGIELAGKTTVMEGDVVQWTAKLLPEAANSTLTWASGYPAVATVDQNGNITAHRPGQANITVTAANGVQKTVLITVVSANMQVSMKINKYQTDEINDINTYTKGDDIWLHIFVTGNSTTATMDINYVVTNSQTTDTTEGEAKGIVCGTSAALKLSALSDSDAEPSAPSGGSGSPGQKPSAPSRGSSTATVKVYNTRTGELLLTKTFTVS